VVTGQEGVDEWGNDGFFIAHDTRKESFAFPELVDDVVPDLTSNSSTLIEFFCVLSFFELTKCTRFVHDRL
jgi:hypothetical protein